jgi:hypothetical protein
VSVSARWICRVCWKQNWADDARCARCKSPRELDEAQVEDQRKVVAARAEQPEQVPDLLVALPAVVFRSYARVWKRAGFLPLLLVGGLVFYGVADVASLLFTAGLSAGLIGFGFAAGEVSEGMRNRELWAFLAGIVMSVVAIIGSVAAFELFAPGIVSPTAIRWGSVIVFGGAGVAAAVGLVLLFTHRRRASS